MLRHDGARAAAVQTNYTPLFCSRSRERTLSIYRSPSCSNHARSLVMVRAFVDAAGGQTVETVGEVGT